MRVAYSEDAAAVKKERAAAAADAVGQADALPHRSSAVRADAAATREAGEHRRCAAASCANLNSSPATTQRMSEEEWPGVHKRPN